MAARLEYNWSKEYKNDKRLLDMREACSALFGLLNKGEVPPEPPIRAMPTKKPKAKEPTSTGSIERRLQKSASIDDGSSTADSDYVASKLQFTNPMAEMSDYESDDTPPPPKIVPKPPVENDSAEESEESDDEIAAKPCMICNLNENDSQSLVCDGCEDVFHTYCIGLLAVPKNDWFCPSCLGREYDKLTASFMTEPVQVLNQWLRHACGCDARNDNCTNEDFALTCVFTKRLLRALAVLSAKDELSESSAMLQKFSDVLAHHVTVCREDPYCAVPMCNQLRQRKTKVQIRPLQ
ncbi:hypothetical protein ACHHYP_12883 [Achlya hypogyna]|uniref:PHD-type domain-containing protein n=1 Tax=Achlya hypogyna TaxID=1202772 RepID=A0A1V9ZG78_ACHHY|nr:hypothetical protein ACHHYP_12883 [Achlya hypogyna]